MAAASSAAGGDMRHHLGQHNGGGGGGGSGMPGSHHGNQQLSQPDTMAPDLGKSSSTNLMIGGSGTTSGTPPTSLGEGPVNSYMQSERFAAAGGGLGGGVGDSQSRKRVKLTASLIPSSGEALQLQEQRLAQALRLHGDPRALGFTLQHVVNQQNNQQP